MQGKTRQEHYRAFIEYVRQDLQRERSVLNRRMFSVFFWCFLLPAGVAATILLLVKLSVLPRSSKLYLDWLMLIFPVLYSLYFLGSQVLVQVPAAFRRGGIATTLGHSIKEGAWRDRVCEEMRKNLDAKSEDFRWIIISFQMDLQDLQYRTRYLTALAGAVFFLLMQGIDSIGEDPTGQVSWVKTPVFGWLEASSNDMSQFVGLALFLILLYLSGTQNYHSLKRYLNCAELLLRDQLPVRSSRADDLGLR